MKRFIVSGLVTICFATVAAAETPVEVLEAYQEFQLDFQKKDYKAAAEHAYDAWQRAEKQLGDHPETRALALNFAYLSYNIDLNDHHVVDAYIRGIRSSENREEKAEIYHVLRVYAHGLEDRRKRQQIKRRIKDELGAQRFTDRQDLPSPVINVSSHRTSMVGAGSDDGL